MKWDWNQYAASGKHWLSYGAGLITMLAAVGLLSKTDASGINENISTIWDGVMKIATGVAGLAAILTPIYTSLKAAHNASPDAQKARVAQQPNTVVVEASPSSSVTDMSNKLAALPSVEKVISTPAVAAATPSSKVVTQ